jgi:hydroxysqualene dehydroxylase
MRSSDEGTIHIIGAGLAGLAAAVHLVDSVHRIVVHEATRYAGGRCRTYYDHVTGMEIDNGTHLLLSGNHESLSYLKKIGADFLLDGPAEAKFDFIDLADGARWSVRFNEGLFPWWIFDKKRRVPHTRARDYLPLARLMWATNDQPLEQLMSCRGALYERFVAPLFLAALNVAPSQGSSKLAGALVRETLAMGGKACHPLIAPDGIGKALVDRAVDYLRGQGGTLHFEHALHELRFEAGRVSHLDFGADKIALAKDDTVILAIPPYAATVMIPGLQAPTVFSSIVNVHFRIHSPGASRMIGVISGIAEWIFVLPGRIAVTVSNAERLLDLPRSEVAQIVWQDVAAVTGLPATIPPWQIVRERRATFAATPEENAKRPGARTRWDNLILAGDWTATGLPATIEGAIRSGNLAADLATTKHKKRAVA